MMEIICVEHDEEAGVFRAVREDSDGAGGTSLRLMVFPEDTLEWRSAEYQIDPTEVDLLMDIVLYETLIVQEVPGPPLLYTASSIDEARHIHVTNVLAAKNKVRPVRNSWKSNSQRIDRLARAGVSERWMELITDDALIRVREGHVMDSSVIMSKLMIVKQRRESGRPVRSKSPASERRRIQAESLRQRALGIGSKSGRPLNPNSPS